MRHSSMSALLTYAPGQGSTKNSVKPNTTQNWPFPKNTSLVLALSSSSITLDLPQDILTNEVCLETASGFV